MSKPSQVGHMWMVRVAVAALLSLVLFLCTALWESRVEMDVNSGLVRHRQTVGCVVVTERVEATRFAILVEELTDTRQPEDWRLDRTREVGRPISPHYRWHGAVTACEAAADVLDAATLPRSTKSAVLKRYLLLLQAGEIQQLDRTVQADFERYVLPGIAP